MKTKQGFTLIELVVACTLLIMLSTIATTSTYNFVQATANLKAQYNNIQNIMLLHGVLANAKLNYATDLAFEIAQGTNPLNGQQTSQAQEAQHAVQQWNISANQNDGSTLISWLINPSGTGSPSAGLQLPLNPGSTSYLPTSRNVPVMTYSNGNPVTTYVVVQITDINSLLQAFQLTDDGTPTGNIVATITVGPMLAGTPPPPTRPTLPIIDWKAGTLQEIRF